MKKKSVQYEEKEENAFSLSTGDLMASLLFIFILLLMGTMLKVKENEDAKNRIVEQYDSIKTSLYKDLNKEFAQDFVKWNVEIDEKNMLVRFNSPDVLFDNGKDLLKEEFKTILKDFFPRYIAVLSMPKYKNNIEEIRIEGHTSSFYNSKDPYYDNMKLSQDRTRNVLRFCLEETALSDKEWLKSKITANGLSSSRLVRTNGQEDEERSRRVEFRVVTNAEEKMEEIARKLKSEN